MAGAMVRISERARRSLRALAEQEGQSMQAVLDKAIEAYKRQRMLEELNAAYAALRERPEDWAEVEAERRTWDGTLADGLVDGDDRWQGGRATSSPEGGG